MARGITLRGAAAGAFVNALRRVQPETDDDRALRIATFIHMEMSKGGRQEVALALVKVVAFEGLKTASDTCAGQRTPAPKLKKL